MVISKNRFAEKMPSGNIFIGEQNKNGDMTKLFIYHPKQKKGMMYTFDEKTDKIKWTILKKIPKKYKLKITEMLI